jgi:hypothetical protein
VRKLIMGIVDFRERMLPQYERRFEALALFSGAICGHAERWREQAETRAETLATFADGAPALVAQDNYHYLACWPDVGALGMLMALLCEKASLATIELPTEVRLPAAVILHSHSITAKRRAPPSGTNRCSAG